MQNENSRNTIIFIVCAAVILIAYQFLVLEPASKRRQAELRQAEAAQVGVEANASAARVGPVASAGGAAPIDRAAAKAQSPRIAIDTPALAGSLSLKGGRIDDLYLKDYREGLDKTSPPVEMLRPEGAERAFAIFYTGTIASGAISPVLYGFLGDGIGVQAATYATALTALAIVPLALALRPHLADDRTG